MPTRWETFPLELSGGLISNLSRLQQGIKSPGSARLIENFEPSIKGGYRRINGYTKFDDDPVPSFGGSLVQGGGQTGTTLVVANLHEDPTDGITFTIAGVTGTYTVVSSTYSSTNKEASITITPALDSSPADKAAITFATSNTLIEGLYYAVNLSVALALKDGVLWYSTGSGWTKQSTPNYGTVLVNGGGQTGTTLAVDGITSDTYKPLAGDTFTIGSVAKVYTVLASPTVTAGAATITIYPALASSPSNDAVITFLNSTHSGATQARFDTFNFDGNPRVVMVDGVNHPVCVCSFGNYSKLQGSADIVGASIVKAFKDHLFLAKNDLVTFSVPFDHRDYTPANGAGSFRLRSRVTGLAIFRTQLICFADDEIKNLSGASVTDFTLTTISDKLGCPEPDTIQEVGGDILFMGPDGIRFLSGTDQFGDFALALASRQITTEMNNYIQSGTNHCSTIIRKKNQYRVFLYTSGQDRNALGYAGYQKVDQDGQGVEWTSLKGINAYRASSAYSGEDEIIIFSNDDGYVYTMESGNSFDGTAIVSRYFTPFVSVNDPNIRKTLFKVGTYYDPEGTFTGTLSIRYDFNAPDKIQPNSLSIAGGGTFAIFGQAIFGASNFGGNPETVLKTSVTGSFFTVSLEYEFGTDGIVSPPFTLDTILLEYSENDRK
jgi:hypothetical protein